VPVAVDGVFSIDADIAPLAAGDLGVAAEGA
jgi:7-keto-8-aminopelargonate synthetase-like enzyme